MAMTVDQVRGLMQSGAHGFPTGRNWDGWCQAFVGWTYTMSHGGNEPTWYGSAKAAWNASTDPYAAPVGALHWFTANHPDYDVKISLGGGRVLHAYRNQDAPWAGLTGIGEDSWESAANKAPGNWMRTTYLGWTYGFGPGGVYSMDITTEEPVPAGAARRWNETGGGVANLRNAPGRQGAVVGSIADGDYGDFKAWTRGENVSGNNIWLQGYHSGNWTWAGSFTVKDGTGLPEIPTAPVEPPAATRPVYKPGAIDTLVQPTAADFPAWISYSEALDSDENVDAAAKNKADWEYYYDKYKVDAPYFPRESHVHWWGDVSAGATHDSIVSYLNRTTDLSADFVTSAGRITRTGSIKTASYTSGAKGMGAWTSENDPRLTEEGYLTLAYLHYIIEKLNPHLRAEAIMRHNEVTDLATGRPFATACSQIDTARVRSLTEQFFHGTLDPATGKAPVGVDPDPEPPVVIPDPEPEPPVVVPPVKPPVKPPVTVDPDRYDKEIVTPTNLTVKSEGPVPDVFFKSAIRNMVYLVSWIGGGVLSILVAVYTMAYGLTDAEIPLWLFLVVAGWSAAQSYFVAPLAKANTPKPTPPSEGYVPEMMPVRRVAIGSVTIHAVRIARHRASLAPSAVPLTIVSRS